MTASRLIAVAASGALVVTGSAALPETPAIAAPFVPCPTVEPAVPRPATPSPPAVDRAGRSIGGEALATSGLVIPKNVPMAPAVTATSWVVADLNRGSVLGGCGPHEYRTPASVQKLLLAAALMPRLDPAETVEVTRADLQDLDPASSVMGVVEGGRYSIESLWLGLLLKSGNDAANVLARIGGGSAGRPGGVQAMNDEARRLHANQTHAVTPSGLDGPGQFSSAYDLALIAQATFAREDFRRYIATRVAEVPAQAGKRAFQIANDNTLLDRYRGMLGGKTGFTRLARQTYVGAAERDGRRLAVTLLGAETAPLGSLGEAIALLDWGFALPPDAAVGNLVAPANDHSSQVPMWIGLGLGLLLLALVVVGLWWWTRARRRAGDASAG